MKLAMCTVVLVVIAMVTVPLIVQALSLTNGGDSNTVYVTVGAPPVSPGQRPIFSPSPPPLPSPPPPG